MRSPAHPCCWAPAGWLCQHEPWSAGAGSTVMSTAPRHSCSPRQLSVTLATSGGAGKPRRAANCMEREMNKHFEERYFADWDYGLGTIDYLSTSLSFLVSHLEMSAWQTKNQWGQMSSDTDSIKEVLKKSNNLNESLKAIFSFLGLYILVHCKTAFHTWNKIVPNHSESKWISFV